MRGIESTVARVVAIPCGRFVQGFVVVERSIRALTDPDQSVERESCGADRLCRVGCRDEYAYEHMHIAVPRPLWVDKNRIIGSAICEAIRNSSVQYLSDDDNLDNPLLEPAA